MKWLLVFILFLVASEIEANPKDLFSTSTPVVSIEGAEVDVEALRDRIRNIHLYESDTDLKNILRTTNGLSALTQRKILSACGREAGFANLVDLHGYKQFKLLTDELEVLEGCLIGVFEFADREMSVPSPGFYSRYSRAYVNQSVEIGYRCGFRSQRAFAFFALSVWFVHPSEISELMKFTCLSTRHADQVFPDFGYEGQALDIIERYMYPLVIFGNWEDTVRYIKYESMVERNREKAICLRVLKSDLEGGVRDLLDSGCSFRDLIGE